MSWPSTVTPSPSTTLYKHIQNGTHVCLCVSVPSGAYAHFEARFCRSLLLLFTATTTGVLCALRGSESSIVLSSRPLFGLVFYERTRWRGRDTCIYFCRFGTDAGERESYIFAKRGIGFRDKENNDRKDRNWETRRSTIRIIWYVLKCCYFRIYHKKHISHRI